MGAGRTQSTQIMPPISHLLAVAAAALLLSPSAQAVIPSNALQLQRRTVTTNSDKAAENNNNSRPKQTTMWASGASFGGKLPVGTRSGPPAGTNDQSIVVEPPSDNPYLCEPIETQTGTNTPDEFDASNSNSMYDYYYVGKTMLVPRGLCSFERKALTAQQLGAELVVVRNTLESRYGLNETSADDSIGNATDTSSPEIMSAGGEEVDGSGVIQMDNDEEIADANDNVNATYEDIIWPQPQADYECANGQALIPQELLSFDPLPYNADHNDPLLSGTAGEGNLCAIYATPDGNGGGGQSSFESRCESQLCLLTGVTRGEGGKRNRTMMEACCAWDLHREMGPDGTIGNTEETTVVIPAVFVTMADGYELLESLTSEVAQEIVSAVGYQRWYPYPNASTFLLWMLGVFVTWLASYLSAWEYRKAYKIIDQAKREGRRVFRVAGAPAATVRRIEEGATAPAAEVLDRDGDAGDTSDAFEDEPEEDMHDVNLDVVAVDDGDRSAPTPVERIRGGDPAYAQDSTSNANRIGPSTVERIRGGYASNVTEEARQGSTEGPGPVTVAAPSASPQQEQHVEIGMYHVLGFIVFASAALFVLFYFEIYRVVTIMYGIGCSGAMALVIFQPLYRYLPKKLSWLGFLQDSPCPKATFCGCNTFTFNEVFSALSGYAIGTSWLYIALTQLDPHTNTYFWVVQNIMGASVSIAFLGVIRVSNIKIATILLIAVFIYDIFMVFITPLFTKEGESVMVTVATSGGPPEDPLFCEKYPTEGDCRQGDPLPMLLTIPRLNDYRGGGNLLGLGDIVLPGLLIAFAARLDAAKRLLKLCTEVYRAEVGGPMPRRPSGSTIASSVEDNGNQEIENEKRSKMAATRQLLFGGYFGPLTIAYGFGLAMAFLAVHLMQTGQPALLYLVPAVLGAMVILGKVKGELKELWKGSNRIKKCDKIVSSVRSLF